VQATEEKMMDSAEIFEWFEYMKRMVSPMKAVRLLYVLNKVDTEDVEVIINRFRNESRASQCAGEQLADLMIAVARQVCTFGH
jgi:hypothetical protein